MGWATRWRWCPQATRRSSSRATAKTPRSSPRAKSRTGSTTTSSTLSGRGSHGCTPPASGSSARTTRRAPRTGLGAAPGKQLSAEHTRDEKEKKKTKTPTRAKKKKKTKPPKRAKKKKKTPPPPPHQKL